MARSTTASGDKMQATVPASLQSAQSFSFACWFFPNANVSWGGQSSPRLISGHGSVENIRVNLTTVAAGRRIQAFAERATTDASVTTATIAFTTGAWNHLVVTFAEDTGFKVYINGAELTYQSNVVGAGTVATIGDYYFMNVADGTRSVDGAIAELGMWNLPLVAADITNLHTNKFAPKKIIAPTGGDATMLAYWPFLGVDSPEKEYVSAANATVNACIQSAHPPDIVYGGERPPRGLHRGIQRGVLV